MPTQTGSLDLKGQKKAADIGLNLEQHFWTDTDGAHVTEVIKDDWEDSSSSDYHSGGNTLIDSYGVRIRKGTTELATFGNTGAQIGQSAQGHINIDYHSLKQFAYDDSNNPYVHFSDLRDSTGFANITEAFLCDGNTSTFSITIGTFEASVAPIVKVDGTQTTDFTRTVGTITLGFTPNYGSVITVNYKTTSDQAKAFTLGKRKANSNIGGHSIALGYDVSAEGNYSLAEGNNSKASGLGSHAEGNQNTASGNYSHVEGSQNTASGNLSHAEGRNTNASGVAAHASGGATLAKGWDSFAGGLSTKALCEAQTVIGRYNEEDPDYSHDYEYGRYAFIIGNGGSDNSRKNALSVSWSGDVKADGDITDGSGNTLSNKLESSDILPLFKKVSVTKTVSSIGANSSKNQSFAPASADVPSGYTRVGIIGWNTANIHVFIATCTGTTVTLANASSSSQTCTNAQVDWLYIRSSI